MTFRSLFQMFRSLFQKTPLKKARVISGGVLVLIATTMWGAVLGTAKLRRSGNAAAGAGKPRVTAAGFNRDVLPIFQASCTQCHGADKAEARLRLVRTTDDVVVFERTYRRLSPRDMKFVEWARDDAAELRTARDRALDDLARDVTVELAGVEQQSAPPSPE